MAPAGDSRPVRARAGAQPGRAGRLGQRAPPGRGRAPRLARRLGYPVDDVVVSRLVDPVDWERDGLERGTPFSIVAPVLPVRTVPARQRRAPGPRAGVRGVRNGARRRGPDGARIGPARRRARGRGSNGVMIDARVPVPLEEAYATCRAADQAPRHDVLRGHAAAAQAAPAPRLRPLRLLPPRRRHRRRPRRPPAGRAGRCAGAARPEAASRSGGRPRRPGHATRSWRRWPVLPPPSTSTPTASSASCGR